MNEHILTLMACGDVGPIHEPMDQYTLYASSLLKEADIRFAQVERVYSDRGNFQLHSAGHHSRLPPSNASIFRDCGFNVVSLASNHAMDWGEEALLDTIELFKSMDIAVVGAGSNLQNARKPAIINKNGLKVAFLAYCSVLREGYSAGLSSAGIAPLRAHSYYEQVDYQAGVPPQVITVPYEDDLSNMIEDIKSVKKVADAVIVSFHWGIHFIPRLIANYQEITAKAAIAAGADMIVGHHAHVPKAIGVYDNKVCFYSLSNFIMSATAKNKHQSDLFLKRYGVALDPEYPYLPYGPDAKKSLIAKALISKNGINQVSFLPLLIDKKLRPEPLKNGDPRFVESVKYMEWVSEGFPHSFSIKDHEVIITN